MKHTFTKMGIVKPTKVETGKASGMKGCATPSTNSGTRKSKQASPKDVGKYKSAGAAKRIGSMNSTDALRGSGGKNDNDGDE